MRKQNFPSNISEIQKWENLYARYRNHNSIVGKIVKYNKYFGFTVDVDGIHANMPIKELSYGKNEEPEKFEGNYFLFIITKINTHKRTLSVSRRKLVTNAKAGDILNGFIIDIEDNSITVDVGFTCRIQKRNLCDYFIKSINDHFKFYTPVKLVLLNDFEKLKYTYASTKKSDIWNLTKNKYKEKDIVSGSILSISDKGLMLDIDDIVKAFVNRKNLSEKLNTQISNENLTVGDCIDIAIYKHNDEHLTIECSVRLLDKIKDKIKDKRMADAFNSFSQRGYIYEVEIIDIQRKYAKIRLGEYEGYIMKDSVSWNEIEEIEDILYIGQIVNVVYLADDQDKLTFGIKQLNPQPYDEDLYNLDLTGLLRLAKVPTTDFIGVARNYGKFTFIEELYSCGTIEGKLLVDPFYGYNLRAIVMNADNVYVGKYYKIKLVNLAPKNLRLERNQLFQFQCKIINEVENPYNKDINEAFQRNTTNPTSNRRDAHLLKEIGKNMYSSKERMFFELIQNADDAAPQKKGVSVNSFTAGDYLVFCHDGFSFDKYDFEAITSAAVGTKKANENKTGYKGIGFKSVFTDSQQVYICTNGYHFKFDKTEQRFQTFDGFYLNNPFLTTEESKEIFYKMYSSVRGNFDGVNDIPWQLEPIHVDEFPSEFGKSFMKSNVAIALRLGEKNISGNSGYESAINSIIDDPKFILFLRKTDRIKFNARTISRGIDRGIITLKNSFALNKVERFERFDFSANVSNEIFEKERLPIRIKIEEKDDLGNIRKAFFVDLEDEQIENIPMKIAISSSTDLSFAIPVNEEGAISLIDNNPVSLFAFLPTLVKDFIFPFYINANFILDPPRQRVLGDSAWNIYLFKVIAEKIVDWSIELSKRNDKNALRVLPGGKFDENSPDTKLLAHSFNEAYISAISNKFFILNENGAFVKQDNIIIDKSGLSDKISHNAFYKILGTSKRFVSPHLDSGILSKHIFSEVESVTEEIILKQLENEVELYNELNEDDYNGLLNWLSDISNLPNSITYNIPSFSDGEDTLSFNEFDANNYIVLTDKIAPIKFALQKLEFKVYENICPVVFNFPFLSEKDVFTLISGRIEDRPDLQLTADDKISLFRTFLSLDGVAEGICSKIKLFKNINGDIKPINEMLAYSNVSPIWLYPYMICSEENFTELQKLLIDTDDEFEKIVWPNIDNINASPIEIIKQYSLEGKDIRRFVDRCKSNDDLEVLLPVIIGSGKETETYFINKVQRIDLKDNEIYTKESFVYRTLQLVLTCYESPSEFSRKIFYNNTCITEFSIKDEVTCEYSEDNTKKSIRMSLAKLLPQYLNQSCIIEKIESLFEIKNDLDRFFDAKPLPLYQIVKALEDKSFLGLSSGEWIYDKNGNAHQYLFYVYYYKEIKRYTSSWLISINLENETDAFVSEMMNFLFENNISINDSPFTYRIKRYFNGKNLSNEFLLDEEKLIPSIRLWADCNEKKHYLIKNGVLDDQCHYILFRSSFLGDKHMEFADKLSDIELRKSIEFIATADRFKKPFIGENQKKVLLNIRNKGVRFLVSRCNFADLNAKSEEWSSDIYKEWKKEHRVQIFLFNGKIPMELLYDDTVLMRFAENDFIYEDSKLYISKDVELNIIFFDIASKGRFGVGLNDYKTLFMSGKVSLSKREFEEKNKQISDLQKENQEKDELLKKYREKYGELNIEKDSPTKVSNIKITANVENSDKTVHLTKADTNILSQQEQIEAQLEAQKYLRSVKPMWKFPNNFAEVDEDGKLYCFSTFHITDEEGNNRDIVLKSYKRNDAPFSINPEEWDSIMDHKAKILIYRGNDIVEIEKEDLVKNQNSIVLRFSTENLDVEDRISQFSDILHYFKQIHFDFESFNISKRAKSILGITNKNEGTQTDNSDEDL